MDTNPLSSQTSIHFQNQIDTLHKHADVGTSGGLKGTRKKVDDLRSQISNSTALSSAERKSLGESFNKRLTELKHLGGPQPTNKKTKKLSKKAFRRMAGKTFSKAGLSNLVKFGATDYQQYKLAKSLNKQLDTAETVTPKSKEGKPQAAITLSDREKETLTKWYPGGESNIQASLNHACDVAQNPAKYDQAEIRAVLNGGDEAWQSGLSSIVQSLGQAIVDTEENAKFLGGLSDEEKEDISNTRDLIDKLNTLQNQIENAIK